MFSLWYAARYIHVSVCGSAWLLERYLRLKISTLKLLSFYLFWWCCCCLVFWELLCQVALRGLVLTVRPKLAWNPMAILLWPPAHWSYRAAPRPAWLINGWSPLKHSPSFCVHNPCLSLWRIAPLPALQQDRTSLCHSRDSSTHPGYHQTYWSHSPHLWCSHFCVLVAAILCFLAELPLHSCSSPPPSSLFPHGRPRYIINTGVITFLLKLFLNFWHSGYTKYKPLPTRDFCS